MKFARDLSKIACRRRLVAALLGAVLLASCGGGEQKEKFHASRVVTFGDENTLIRADGRQYTVNNDSAPPPATPCSLSPIWVQSVAAEYGLTFGECLGTTARDNAVMRAAVGSTVATVAQAMADFNAAGAPLKSGDLVTLMVGAYDLIELATATPTPSDAELAALKNAAFERGRSLGSVVFDATARGAKGLITTVHNLGVTPLALRNELSAAVLSALTVSFNDGLYDRLSEDPNGGGRSGALLEVDQQIEKYRRNFNGAYIAFTNYTDAACKDVNGVPFATADLPTCNAMSNASYLWAGRIQFGLVTHGQLGSDAVARLRANPL